MHFPIRFLSLILIVPLLYSMALAKEEQPYQEMEDGPQAGFEITSPTNATVGNQTWSTGHRLLYADLFAPIPVSHFLIVPKIDLLSDTEVQSGNIPDTLNPQSSRVSLSTMALGMALVSPARNGSPEWFVLASRYSAFDFHSSPPPMFETIAGVTLKPFFPNLNENHPGGTLLAVRVRFYPGLTQILPILGRKFDLSNGYFLNVLIPSDLIFSWEDPDWQFSAGVHLKDINFPYQSNNFTGWLQGYALAGGVAARRKLYDCVHLKLELGLESDIATLNHTDGREAISYTNNLAPWGEISLVTLFPAT